MKKHGPLFSHAAQSAAAVVRQGSATGNRNLQDILQGRNRYLNLILKFDGQYSAGFDAKKDLQRIGVINQNHDAGQRYTNYTRFSKTGNAPTYYQLKLESTIEERFADTRDTLCYATNDNQTAVSGVLETEADLAIVVGGYKSSNTSHLVELCEERLPTYFISE